MPPPHSARVPGLVLTDHTFHAPLDYANPGGEQITLFARAVTASGQQDPDLPWLLFLQGGPGFPSPRPENASGWLGEAVKHHRVLLLDDRGTGRSTPVTHQTLARLNSPQAQAAYLTHFRADAIVRDAERIRQQLIGDAKWTLLGQSYGGFCIATYLSMAPEGVEAAMITGGLPPIGQPVDAVYRATYARVLEQNQRYYARYPADVERVRAIMDRLQDDPVPLPGGGLLTPRRFQQLGLAFGAQNGFEEVHYLIEEAFAAGAVRDELAYPFLRGVENAQHVETNPIFALLHEAIYLEGQASRWSAERVRAEYPQFALTADAPIYFTGEMIYPWMFDDYAYLRPLKQAAELLAEHADWPQLYDLDVLARNKVPCVATIYHDDMYVERRFAEDAARKIQGTRVWLTNEFAHSALRMNGETIYAGLRAMLRGER